MKKLLILFTCLASLLSLSSCKENYEGEYCFNFQTAFKDSSENHNDLLFNKIHQVLDPYLSHDNNLYTLTDVSEKEAMSQMNAMFNKMKSEIDNVVKESQFKSDESHFTITLSMFMPHQKTVASINYNNEYIDTLN